MLDKLIKLVKAQRSLKRVCIFFLAFAASLTVMGSNHDVFYGNGSQMAPEKAPTASSSGVAVAQGSANSLMPIMQATTLEEIVTTAVADKKDGPTVESKLEDEEDADDEADSVNKKPKSSSTETKADAEPTDKTATKKKAEKSGDEESEDEKSADNSEPSGFVYSDQIPMSLELQKYTYAKCEERGLEYELVLAIIWRESRFTVDAVNVNTNGTRDNGIMQINDVNRKWLRDNYGITDLMDPYQNIDAGTAMLGNLTKKYGSHNAMMAYQYGEGGMASRLKRGITTSHAIEQAYKQRDYYRKIL